ncbi:unnamed protein product, partial [Rotaria magnacalcarata]
GLCEKLYVFLTGSTKRVVVLRNIYSSSTNKDTLSLKDLSDMRWTAQYSSVVAIHESFNEIVDTLDELCNDNDKTTKLEANSIREK